MRETKYYFGRTSTDDYLAYNLGHIFLHGRTQFYLDAYVDSFLLRFIEETTPNEVTLRIHDCCATEAIWQDKYLEGYGWKGISIIDSVKFSVKGDNIMGTLYDMHDLYEKRIKSPNLSKEKNMILLLRDYNLSYSEDARDEIMFLLKNGASAKIYLILTSSGEDVEIEKEVLAEFDYILSTTNSEENSQYLFGTDDASEDVLPAFGIIIVKYGIDILRFNSLFSPYTFIKKVIRSLSVSKDAYHTNEEIKDVSND